MAVFVVGNIALGGCGSSYAVLMAARFLTGLPHGAFFGIGAVVAATLVPLHRRAWAVSMTFVGLPVANIIGVPLTTLIGQQLGWHGPFARSAASGCHAGGGLVLGPAQPVGGDATWAASSAALARPQVWLALLVGTVGFGGMFATYSYIAPTMTELAGFTAATVPSMLAVYGVA